MSIATSLPRLRSEHLRGKVVLNWAIGEPITRHVMLLASRQVRRAAAENPQLEQWHPVRLGSLCVLIEDYASAESRVDIKALMDKLRYHMDAKRAAHINGDCYAFCHHHAEVNRMLGVRDRAPEA